MVSGYEAVLTACNPILLLLSLFDREMDLSVSILSELGSFFASMRNCHHGSDSCRALKIKTIHRPCRNTLSHGHRPTRLPGELGDYLTLDTVPRKTEREGEGEKKAVNDPQTV